MYLSILRSLLTLCAIAMVACLSGQPPLLDDYLPEVRESNPVLRADGGELFFARYADPSNQGRDNAADVWFRAAAADGSWERAINPGSPVNSPAHDLPLALNADGTLLAVLRDGVSDHVELLERRERNWRVVASWPLPNDVVAGPDVAFDLNAQRLVYSARGSSGTRDLYARSALGNGRWSAPENLTLLNGPNDALTPRIGSDGRTLFFASAGRWWRQTERGRRAEPTGLPEGIRDFSAPVYTSGATIMVVADRGSDPARVAQQPAAATMMPPTARLVRGYLSAPPSPGERTARVALTNGRELPVYPDALQRFELYLRPGEELTTDRNQSASGRSEQNSQGSLAAADRASADRAALSDRQLLERGIATRERELRRLDEERRRYDLALPKTTDPELDALRERYQRAQPGGDTLPPAGGSVKDKYARELEELEAMKAKFRRQQEEKLRSRSGNHYRWTAKSNIPSTRDTVATRLPQRSISDYYYPPAGSPAPRSASRQDSLNLDATVRSGLYPDRRPRAYERASWENSLRNDLPRSEPLPPEEAARLDAEYQRQQAELEALRARLQRMNGEATPPARLPAAQSEWSSRGAATTPASEAYPAARPATYGNVPARPAPTPPYAAPNAAPTAPSQTAGVVAGISFIPNTAYPDGAGYTGLDQLLRQLRQRNEPLEIRVHTAASLSRRAAQLLSEERATTIREFLSEEGVPGHLYRVVGFGNNLTGNGGERVELLAAPR